MLYVNVAFVANMFARFFSRCTLGPKTNDNPPMFDVPLNPSTWFMCSPVGSSETRLLEGASSLGDAGDEAMSAGGKGGLSSCSSAIFERFQMRALFNSDDTFFFPTFPTFPTYLS